MQAGFPSAVIHPMTGCLKPNFSQTSVTDKPHPRQCALPRIKVRDVGAFHARKVDFGFIKTQFSHGFGWNA
jgi:hypothetical protein